MLHQKKMRFNLAPLNFIRYRGIASKFKEIWVPMRINFETIIESAPFIDHPLLFADVEIDVALKLVNLQNAAKYVSQTTNLGSDFYAEFLNSFWNYDPRFNYNEKNLSKKIAQHVHCSFLNKGYIISSHKTLILSKKIE